MPTPIQLATTTLSNATPQPNGAGAAGTSPDAARADHVHPAVNATAVKMASGVYYRPTGGTQNAVQNSNGIACFTLFQVFEDTTFDRIAAQVSAAGTAGALIRLAIFADNQGKPGAVTLDAGTTPATATGVLAITISQLLAVGNYWLAVASQGAPTTTPSLRAQTGASPGAPMNAAEFTFANGWLATGVTGAFAANPTVSPTGDAQCVALRKA